jgi:hypothetical protein
MGGLLLPGVGDFRHTYTLDIQQTVLSYPTPFESWTEIMGSERLTGALLDRLTHRIHILEANGESYRLRESRQRLKKRSPKPNY